MIPHVAEAGEVRGRVVLRFGLEPAHPLALEAAVRVAHAFQAEVEGLYVEDAELFAMAAHTFTREIAHGGRGSRPVSIATIASDLDASARSVRRMLDRIAAAADVPVAHRTVRADPVAALQAACAEVGPWNVIALAEPLGARDGPRVRMLLQAVTDAQGLIFVTRAVKRRHGPVIVALEAIDRLTSMMHAADRLARASTTPIVVMAIGRSVDECAEVEGHARLLLGDREDLQIAPAIARFGDPAWVIDAINRRVGSVLLAEFGGLAMPADTNFAVAVAALECPVFLVR